MSLSVLPRTATLDFVPLEGPRLSRVLEWQQSDHVAKPAATTLYAQRFYGSGGDSDTSEDESSTIDSRSEGSSGASSLFAFDDDVVDTRSDVGRTPVTDVFADLDNEVAQVFVTPPTLTLTPSDHDSDQLFDENLNSLTAGTRIVRRVTSPAIMRLSNMQRHAAETARQTELPTRLVVRTPRKTTRSPTIHLTPPSYERVISLSGDNNDSPVLASTVTHDTVRRYDVDQCAYTLDTLDTLFSKGLADENAHVRAYATKIKAHYVSRIEQHRMSLAQATRKYERHAQLIKRTSDLAWLKTHYTYPVWHLMLQLLPCRPLWQRSDGETTRAVAAHYGRLYEHILSYSNQIAREPDADRLYVVLYTPDCEFRQRNDFTVKADFRWANCFYATVTSE